MNNEILREILSTGNEDCTTYLTELYKYLVDKNIVMKYHVSVCDICEGDFDKSEKANKVHADIISDFENENHDFIDQLVGDYIQNCNTALCDIDRGF
jgi:hypothetical protein